MGAMEHTAQALPSGGLHSAENAAAGAFPCSSAFHPSQPSWVITSALCQTQPLSCKGQGRRIDPPCPAHGPPSWGLHSMEGQLGWGGAFALQPSIPPDTAQLGDYPSPTPTPDPASQPQRTDPPAAATAPQLMSAQLRGHVQRDGGDGAGRSPSWSVGRKECQAPPHCADPSWGHGQGRGALFLLSLPPTAERLGLAWGQIRDVPSWLGSVAKVGGVQEHAPAFWPGWCRHLQASSPLPKGEHVTFALDPVLHLRETHKDWIDSVWSFLTVYLD